MEDLKKLFRGDRATAVLSGDSNMVFASEADKLAFMRGLTGMSDTLLREGGE